MTRDFVDNAERVRGTDLWVVNREPKTASKGLQRFGTGSMGKIVRAYGWEDTNEQRFVTINPLADEVSVYQTIHKPVSTFDGLIQPDS